MKKNKLISSIFLMVFFAANLLVAGVPKDKASILDQQHKLNKAAVKEWKFFDVNTLNSTIASDGPYHDNRRTSSSGLFWPKGTPKTAVFTAGMWVIGFHRPTGILRAAVQNYSTDFQPGPILTTFNTTTNSNSAAGDFTDKRYRLYKVIRKDSVGGVNADYDEWPGDLGAPYIDVNGNGKWDKGTDKPKLWGDQQIWCVYNDANGANHNPTSATNPMGIEIQTTYFGFDQPGALGNIMFMRWKIINKSDADYDSVFISMWSDTDMGDANDDVSGCDTLRKLGYTYNGDNNDAGGNGYGDKPPANGFVFFQGPKVLGSATDSALFEGKKIAGYRNLPATSHAVYVNGGTWNDPPLGQPTYAERAYNYMNGLIGASGQPFINPQTGLASKFVFPGDPVTGTGWLQSTSGINPDDMRSMLSSGPYTLAKGDTQEIVGGFVIGQGTDRLNSIEVLRRYVSVAQEAFDVNFALASPPPAPSVTVAELPNQVILNWGDPKSYTATESYNFKGAAKDYKFEGYNIYQISSNSSTATAKRIATYDLVDNVKTVMDFVTDPVTGLLLNVPVVFGEDNGVKRSFTIDQDYFANTRLVNGKEYYFAVTSYAYNFDPNGEASGVRKVLENSIALIRVTPRQIAVGDKLGGAAGQSLLTNRGINGDDVVVPVIVNPRELKGTTYNITFNGVDTVVTSWNLIRQGSTDTVILKNTNFNYEADVPIIDGVQIRIRKPAIGPRRDEQTPRGYSYTPANNLWFRDQVGVGMDAFKTDATVPGSGAIVFPRQGLFNVTGKGTSLKPYELKKVEIRFSNTVKQKAYRYLSNVRTGPGGRPIRDPSFVPFVLVTGTGMPYQDYVEVPFTVWEVDSLDGSYAPRQLNVGFVENNDSLRSSTGAFLGLGRIDGKWMPTNATTGGGEPLYIFSSTYSDSALVKYTKNPGAATNMNLATGQDSLDVMYGFWVRALDTVKTFANGDKFTIVPNYPLTASSTFTLATPKNTTNSASLIKNEMERINVFPNPYFANNRAETNVYQRFVTFTNLPPRATIRIFNLAGELLKRIQHNSPSVSGGSYTSGYEQWDLRNEAGLPVSSGMYIAYIEIPNAGTRILKIAIIQPEERPTR